MFSSFCIAFQCFGKGQLFFKKAAVLQGNYPVLALEAEAFQGMLQFPDITRPFVLLKQGNDIWRNARGVSAGFRIDFADKMLTKGRNIFQTFTEGRESHRSGLITLAPGRCWWAG